MVAGKENFKTLSLRAYLDASAVVQCDQETVGAGAGIAVLQQAAAMTQQSADLQGVIIQCPLQNQASC